MNDDESDDFGINTGLSGNEAINWTNSMMEKYRDYLFWHFFVHNEKIEWNMDLLTEYEPWIEKFRMDSIKPIWKKVFLPLLDEKIISEICEENRHEILAIIREKEERLQNMKFYDPFDPS